MWVFTSTGFVSAVVHRDEPDLIVVRARDLASLEPLIVRTGAEGSSSTRSARSGA